ncbi:MAG: hypothetical protein VZR27_05110, partial [Acutalibacteraceae bacterium]|nr:hypothetical protein [Acutalibacteraceae bacterium]
MKTKIKRLSKSTVSLLLTLMMLFSCVTSSGAVTIKPESAPTTVDETAVNENTVEETIGDETAVGETAVDETPAQTDENTVTVDIEPEDVQTTVLTEEEIKGEQ